MTDVDRTIYFETLPANQLELPLFIEADRLRSLVITQEKFATERNVVQEEWRMRIDNQPYGKSREVLNELLYDSFEYKHHGIGLMEDLNAAAVEDVKEFFKNYYAPNNCVLVLAGDFNTAEEQVDLLGAALVARAELSSFTTTVTASGLAQNFDEVLELFAEVIRHPIFPPEEVEKYKSQTLAQLQLQRADPRFLARERFSLALYGEHPAGIISPPVDSLKRVSSAELARFHAAHYLPNNAMLAVTGQLL